MILKDKKSAIFGFCITQTTTRKTRKTTFFKIDFDSLIYIVPETKPKTKKKFWVSSRVLNTGDSGIY